MSGKDLNLQVYSSNNKIEQYNKQTNKQTNTKQFKHKNFQKLFPA